MTQPTRTRIRATDYFQRPEYQEHALIQLIDGKVILGTTPNLKHQIVVGDILYLLATVEQLVGGLALVAPTEVYFDEVNVYEPDVMYISPDNLDIAQQAKQRIVGAPDLVVEVLSPSTAKYDRQEKYQAYEAHGVREYWIVDPIHETIEVWTLNEATFKRQGAYGDNKTFASLVLSQTVDVTKIFAVQEAI